MYLEIYINFLIYVIKIKNLTTQRIMKTNEIKEQLNLMYNFMDADENLCGCADIDYDYEKYLEDNYKIIAKRLNFNHLISKLTPNGRFVPLISLTSFFVYFSITCIIILCNHRSFCTIFHPPRGT